jgi:glycosyltransferase involved in cell wall biosynthesis
MQSSSPKYPALGLTIVVPVFNEEECLPRFCEEMQSFLVSVPVTTVVLFVNDGSRDDSQKIIAAACASNNSFSYLQLDGNYGLSTAIKAGIDACDSELVGYIDADLQTSPADFLNFLEYFPEYDMVNGIRARRQDTIVKKASSKFANSFRRLMINDGITDTCCPLKIMKTTYAKRIPFFTGMHRFLPALIQLQGGRVQQLPVAHFPRFAGTAKYHLLNRLVGPFFDTLAFRWMRSRYIRYGIADRTP